MARTIHPEGTASQRDASTSHGSWHGESAGWQQGSSMRVGRFRLTHPGLHVDLAGIEEGRARMSHHGGGVDDGTAGDRR
jgi:hypothetical protein